MSRVAFVVGLQLLAALVGLFALWLVVPLVAGATFAGGFAWATAESRGARARWAARVGVVDAVMVGLAWAALAAVDPALAATPLGVRAGLTCGIGLGAGFAGAALCMVGADARLTAGER